MGQIHVIRSVIIIIVGQRTVATPDGQAAHAILQARWPKVHLDQLVLDRCGHGREHMRRTVGKRTPKTFDGLERLGRSG